MLVVLFLYVSGRQALLADHEVVATNSGFVDDNTYFIEFQPGGVGYKVTSSPTLDFSNQNPVALTMQPAESGEHRFEFDVDPSTMDVNFFRVESIDRSQLPYCETVTALGDSITSGANIFSARAMSDGYLGSYFDLDEHRTTPIFSQPEGTWFQTGGFTSQQIIDNWLPRVIAAKPDICVVLAGANSLNDARSFFSDSDLAANWIFEQNRFIVRSLVGAGIQPIYCTMTPDTFPTDTSYPPANGFYHPSYRTIRRKVNDLARAHIRDEGAILCDWAGVLSTDPGDDEALADANWYSDNIHPNGQGRIQMAKYLQGVINSNFRTPEPFVIPENGAEAWVLPNPYLEGDSDGLATGWNLYGNAIEKSATKVGTNSQSISVRSAYGALKGATFQRHLQVVDNSLDGIMIRPVCRLVMPDAAKLPVWVELRLVSNNLDDSSPSQESFVQRLGGSGNANAMTRQLSQNDMLMLGPPIKTVSGTGAERRRITLLVSVYGGDEEATVILETCGVIKVVN